jgi:hypothetical protein
VVHPELQVVRVVATLVVIQDRNQQVLHMPKTIKVWMLITMLLERLWQPTQAHKPLLMLWQHMV